MHGTVLLTTFEFTTSICHPHFVLLFSNSGEAQNYEMCPTSQSGCSCMLQKLDLGVRTIYMIILTPTLSRLLYIFKHSSNLFCVLSDL